MNKLVQKMSLSYFKAQERSQHLYCPKFWSSRSWFGQNIDIKAATLHNSFLPWAALRKFSIKIDLQIEFGFFIDKTTNSDNGSATLLRVFLESLNIHMKICPPQIQHCPEYMLISRISAGKWVLPNTTNVPLPIVCNDIFPPERSLFLRY